MLFSIACATTLLVGVFGSITPGLQKKSEGGLKLDFKIRLSKKLFRRDESEELDLSATRSYYECNLYVGSQGSENTVMIDTGSSDLWVMDSNVVCYLPPTKRDFSIFSMDDPLGPKKHQQRRLKPKGPSEKLRKLGKRDSVDNASPTSKHELDARANTCLDLGSFNTGSSDTFKHNSSAEVFYIEYMDDSYALGSWGKDNIRLGNLSGLQLYGASFGVVNQTNSEFGVLGIGLPWLEMTYALPYVTNPYIYENFPMLLKSQGHISHTGYSLYLTQGSGSVLFGAVDHAKYSGTLQTVPMLDTYLYSSTPSHFYVIMNSILMEGGSSNFTVTDRNIAVLFDSGTTISYLPYSIYIQFGAMLGGTYTSYGYRVSCTYYSNSYHFVFNFSGVQIRVPFSEMILEYSSGCYLDVSSLGRYNVATFGDNFLRSAYVVHDLENYEILLAQFNDTDEEHIEDILLTVPLAVKAESYSSTSIDYSATIGTSATAVTFLGVTATSEVHSSEFSDYSYPSYYYSYSSIDFSYFFDSFDFSFTTSETGMSTNVGRTTSLGMTTRLSTSSSRQTSSSSRQITVSTDLIPLTTSLPSTSSFSSLSPGSTSQAGNGANVTRLSVGMLLSLIGILLGLV